MPVTEEDIAAAKRRLRKKWRAAMRRAGMDVNETSLFAMARCEKAARDSHLLHPPNKVVEWAASFLRFQKKEINAALSNLKRQRRSK